MTQAAVLKLLKKYPKGLTVEQIAKKLKISKSAASNNVRRLRDPGRIVKVHFENAGGVFRQTISL